MPQAVSKWMILEVTLQMETSELNFMELEQRWNVLRYYCPLP